MDKEQFKELLDSLGIAVNEGIQNDQHSKTLPRCVYFEFAWNDIIASGTQNHTEVDYQISFYAKTPRDEKLVELKEKLNQNGFHPQIFHEYIETERMFHSYMSVSIVENV